MRCKFGMTFYRRKASRPAAFICDRVGVANTERKVRVVIKKKRRDVVVEDKKQNVRLLSRKPLPDGLVALKNRRPVRVGLFVCVESETYGWCMRTGDCANYRCHKDSW